MIHDPRKVSPTGLSPDLRAAFNNLVDFVKANILRGGHGIEVDRTSGGTFIRPRGGSTTVKVADDVWY